MRTYEINSTLVKPAAPTPKRSLWISNVDAVMHSYHTPSLYIYRPNGAADFFDPAVLKEALSCVLVAFYPAAGRLSRDENGRIEINCNNDGVLFVEAECDGTLDDLGDFSFKSKIDGTLVPVVDYSQGISTYPLMLFQVTRFRCGGVSLGVRNEHHLSDGMSALHLINTWSDIAQGLEIAIPPVIDRSHLSARYPAQPQFDHIEYKTPPPLMKQKKLEAAHETAMSIFKLTCDQLNALKASCKEDRESNDHVSYSTYEILAGHIWCCACKARGLLDDQISMVNIPIDGRSRLQPHVPQEYFGNVIFFTTPMVTSGEIQTKPLKHVVNIIHESLAQMNNDYLRSALDYLEQQPDLSALAIGDYTYKCPNLGINSWAKLPVYDADFGWGRPIYLGPGAIPCEGKFIMLQSPTNDGSLLLAASLQMEHLKLFEKFLYDI